VAKVVTIGEIMLRLSTQNYSRFVQAGSFDVVYGGGEANVAVSLANYGHNVYFVTKLPEHEIGQSAVNYLRKYGVNTDYIVREGNRIGIYFLETGASIRASKVIYDRANSAIAEANSSEFDFNKIFKDASWFHWTGITPAISDKSAKLIEVALVAAKKYDITVSVDLNFRKKLWTTEQAQKVMTKLMKYVDVCIGNEEDAEKCLGFTSGDIDVATGNLKPEAYKCILKEMQEKFGFKYVAITLRESYSASDNGWSAIIYNGEEFYVSNKYKVGIVDRIGVGDAFAGGLIHKLLTKSNMKEALEYAVAASALKHTISGDFNLISEEEVEKLLAGDTSGRVQR
jgi:2-dehydro-3-deoxygluconokinase